MAKASGLGLLNMKDYQFWSKGLQMSTLLHLSLYSRIFPSVVSNPKCIYFMEGLMT